MTTEAQPHVIIVGGGFGGLLAAQALRNAPVQITLIDRTNHHVFQPLLYQVATAGLSPADIAAPIRNVLRAQRNVEVQMAEVTDVDTDKRCVCMGERTLSYDYLILATGARESYFGRDEWKPHAPGLKTLPDATSIRQKMLLAFEAAEMETDPDRRQALLTFALVGAGATGVEMAGAIAEVAHRALASDFRQINPRSTRILLLEAGPRILSAFPEKLSERAHKALVRMGVEVRVNSAVEQVDADGVIVAGERIACRNVIWTAGVVASSAGKWLGVETDRNGRVTVLPDLSTPGHPEVFVIGDTARVDEDGRPLPGVAPVAMQQGRYVASVIRSRVQSGAQPPPFKYKNKGNLATVGRSFAIVHIGKLQLSGFFAWVLWLSIHIFYLIGFRNRILVMIEWAWAYLTFQRGARLITSEGPPNAAPPPKPPVPRKRSQPRPFFATKLPRRCRPWRQRKD